jgi:hypothetical protein
MLGPPAVEKPEIHFQRAAEIAVGSRFKVEDEIGSGPFLSSQFQRGPRWQGKNALRDARREASYYCVRRTASRIKIALLPQSQAAQKAKKRLSRHASTADDSSRPFYQ